VKYTFNHGNGYYSHNLSAREWWCLTWRAVRETAGPAHAGELFSGDAWMWRLATEAERYMQLRRARARLAYWAAMARDSRGHTAQWMLASDVYRRALAATGGGR
jgi:hypothetical protein